MKRKLLLTALCISSVMACSIGLTACGDKTPEPTPTEHTHAWGNGWTVTDANKPTATTEGKATRTCSNSGCDATAADKEYTLPKLDSADYSKTQDTATCSAAGKITYTYNKDGVNVHFDAATEINANAHKFGGTYYKAETESEGHYQKCEHNGEHHSAVEAHDTKGTDGACSKCGYKATVTPPEHTHNWDTTVWYNNSTHHWHNCTADNCDVTENSDKNGYGAHDTNGTGGTCSVCGYDPTPAETINGTGNATVTVGGGKKAKINAHSFGNGYYTYTYEGDKPITVKYSYPLLGTGEVTDTVTLSWEGEHSFVAQLSTKTTCVLEISSDSATPFNATITATFSETDPRPAPTLALGTATTVNATYDGTVYEFTAATAGSYTLACTDSKAVICLATDEETPLTLPYTFTLDANGKISFLMKCNDIGNPTATYDVTVTAANVHNHSWGDWTVTEANKPTADEEGKATRTCNGSGDCNATVADKEYTLPTLDSEDYTITDNTATVDGAGTGTYSYNKNGVSVSFTAATPAIDSLDFTITVTGAGSGVTVKLGKYSATTNAQGVATVKAEKQEYDVIIENNGYSFTAATVTVANPAATVVLPTFKSGSTSDERFADYAVITGAGVYTTTITAKADPEIADKYTVGERYFRLDNANDAKKYTIKILSVNTTISPDETGYSMITGVGESYYIVLEQGDSTIFNISTNDEEDITAGYSKKVVFEIVESDAPEAGVYDRPIRLENGVESTTNVSAATDKVYFRLDYATFGKYATITFGDGVTVYNLGLTKAGEGTTITSGNQITIGEHNPAYLYAVSTGASVALTATPHYVDGMKEQPFNVTVGETNNPTFDIDTGVREQWYKLQVSADGTYIIKSDANHAILEIYNDVNGEAVKTASGGAGVSVVVAANTPVYIRAASNMNQTYAFTVTEFSDADKGVSKDAPLALTSTGDYNVYTTRYYTYTATQNERVTLTVSNVGHSVYFYHHTDETYDDTKLVGGKTFANTLSFLAEAGKTYYFHTNTEANGGTMTLAVETLAAHDHVITVSGADSKADITVKVMNGNTEVASSTTDANGSVTLNFIPGNYKIVLENLPTGYGYFADYALTVLNDSETSYIDVKLYALADYSLTIKKPDGTGAAGITVTFTNEITGTFTAETDENGVAKITDKLPPMVKKQSDGTIGTGGSFAVTFELPEILSGDFIYTGDAISLTSATKTSEKTLTNMFAYVLTLVDGDNNALPAGIDVTLMNGSTIMATATTVDGGIATFTKKIVAGEYTVVLSNNYVTEAKTSATANTLTAICTSSGGGAIDGGTTKAPALINGSGTHSIKVAEGATGYFQFSGNGKKYTITVSGSYFHVVRLNGTTANDKVIQSNAISLGANVSDSDVTIDAKNDSGQVTSFTLTISNYIYFGIKGAFEGTITITEVTE